MEQEFERTNKSLYHTPIHMKTIFESIRTFQQPDYTGENRCTPCTIVNLCIAGLLSISAFMISLSLSIAVFLACCGVILLRGYLVPGTPTITRRYFPDYLLRWFDKSPRTEIDRSVHGEDGGTADPVSLLIDIGVIVDPEEGDLRLSEEFRNAWRDHVEVLRGEDPTVVLGRLFSIDSDSLSVGSAGGRMTVHRSGDLFTLWPSQAAYLADVAASEAVSERSTEWNALTHEQRGRILQRLRVFLDQCPSCQGTIEDGEATRGCCVDERYFEVSCEGCGATILEASISDGADPDR